MKVKGTAMWASVQQPNTTFEPVYQIDLIVDKDTADSLRDIGVKVKKTDDGYVAKFKRKLYRKDGTENQKPKVVDAQLNDFNDLIGNGSEVIVQFGTYEWSNRFGSGIGTDLKGVQVLKLVPYANADGGEFEPVDVEDTEKPIPPKTGKFDDELPDVLF